MEPKDKTTIFAAPNYCLMRKILPFMLLVAMTSCTVKQNEAEKTAQDVIQRFAGAKANVELHADLPKTENDCGQFSYVVNGNRLVVHGSSATALCRGFYDFTKSQGTGICSWSGTGCEWPDEMPDMLEKHVVSPFAHHYYFNVVTYGYTMPYWDWNRWEQEIDWMALHGVDMPLALVANEAISARVWKQIGMTDDEINAYFVGPAHLPWMRMGNISGIDGPLDEAWHNEQIALQHKILDRMRLLDMKPICPGFAGFVPKAIQRIYPEVTLTETSWCDGQFHNWMLSPTDTLFTQLGKMFIEEWEKEFGENQYYIIDSFNEMETPFPPKGSDERYELLATYGERVYQSLSAGNPDAVWVMQGWMLGYQRYVWDQPTLAALLSRVPDDKMMILDMAVDYNENFWHNSKNWDEYEGFYGKQWVFSFIPNMGGKSAPTGMLEHYANGRLEALRSPNRGKLVGYGMAPEGLENNEVIYELITDGGWTTDSIDLNDWLASYCRCRYGQYTPAMRTYWDGLRQSVYGGFTDHPRFNWQLRPGLCRCGSVMYDSTYFHAVETLVESADPLRGNALFEADLAEATAMYAGAYLEMLTQSIEENIGNGNQEAAAMQITQFEQLMRDIDQLLSVHPTLRFDRWIDFAHQHSNGDTLRDQAFERNAKRIVTIWGPPVDDYSARIWSGLIRDYYLPRWQAYFGQKISGKPFDFAEWERQWVDEKTSLTPVEKPEDVIDFCKKILGECCL